MGKPTAEQRSTADRRTEKPPFDRVWPILQIANAFKRRDELLDLIERLTGPECVRVQQRFFEGPFKDPVRARFWRFSTYTRNLVHKTLADRTAIPYWDVASPGDRLDAVVASVARRPPPKPRRAKRKAEQPPYEQVSLILQVSDRYKRRDLLLAHIEKISGHDAYLIHVRLFSDDKKDPLRARFRLFSGKTRERIKQALLKRADISPWDIEDPKIKLDAIVSLIKTLEPEAAAQTLVDLESKDGNGNAIYPKFKALDALDQMRLLSALRDRAPKPPPRDPAEDARIAEIQNEQLRRLIEVDGHPVYGKGFVGLAPATMAAPVTIAIMIERIGRSLYGFIVGLIAGLGSEIGEDDAEALRDSMVTHFYEIPLMGGAFLAGTAVGIVRDVKDTIEMVIELVGEFDEFVRVIKAFFGIVLSEAGYDICYEIGYALGAEQGRKISALVRTGPANIAYEIGKLIGPTVVFIILAACGIPVGIGPALQKAIAVLKRFRRFAELAEMLGKQIKRAKRGVPDLGSGDPSIASNHRGTTGGAGGDVPPVRDTSGSTSGTDSTSTGSESKYWPPKPPPPRTGPPAPKPDADSPVERIQDPLRDATPAQLGAKKKIGSWPKARKNWEESAKGVLEREYRRKFDNFKDAEAEFLRRLQQLQADQRQKYAERMYDRTRKRFYRREGKDPSYDYSPMTKVKDPAGGPDRLDYDAEAAKKMQKRGKAMEETTQLDHDVEIQDDPTKALDPDNLQFTQGGPGGTAPKGTVHDAKTQERRRGRPPKEPEPPEPPEPPKPPEPPDDPRGTSGGKPKDDDRSTD